MADGVQGDGQDLHELSDGDLENICTSRGFQLVREVDDATGELYVYSHEDFIDAARQCLQMEDEMEQLLREHPELIDEVKAEAQRMEAENERLKDEVAKAQELEKNNSENEKEDGDQVEEKEVTDEVDQNTMEASAEATPPENKPIEDVDTADLNELQTEETDTIESLTDEGDVGEIVDDEPIEADNETMSEGTDGRDTSQPNEGDSLGDSRNPLGLKELAIDSLHGLKKQAHADIMFVWNALIPKPLQDQIVIAIEPVVRVSKQAIVTLKPAVKQLLVTLKPAMRIAKQQALCAYNLVKKHATVAGKELVEKSKKYIDEKKQERDENSKNSEMGKQVA
eukprot:scaffold286601_cov59-Attheya_sp.AAC.3